MALNKGIHLTANSLWLFAAGDARR